MRRSTTFEITEEVDGGTETRTWTYHPDGKLTGQQVYNELVKFLGSPEAAIAVREKLHKGGELYQAKVSPETRAYLKVKAAEKNLSDNPIIAALLGDTDGFIETRKGRVEIPFDGGGLHSVARHLIETGKAKTGGVTLTEVADALPKPRGIKNNANSISVLRQNAGVLS